MVNSVNLPVRKGEEKCRRKEGKSQCRRGVPKPKAPPAVFSIPTKSPSPASTPLTPLPPPVVPPPMTNVTLPIPANILKDPTAMTTNFPSREGKVIRRKIKTSSENDGPVGSRNEKKKKNSQTSSNSGRKKLSSKIIKISTTKSGKFTAENKSDGSKEPSDNEDKPKFNKDLAKNFLKHMMESQRARKRSADARLETMPESSQMNISAKAFRKKKGSGKLPQDSNIFKPNGDPVWVVSDLPLEECLKTEDGVTVTNPELAQALADENLTMDEKNYIEYGGEYMACNLKKGLSLPEDYQFDPLAPEETLEANNKYISGEAINYNTAKNWVDLSENSMKRFAERQDGMDQRVRPRHSLDNTTTTTETTTSSLPPTLTASQEKLQLKTCVMSIVTFNIKHNVTVNYDRRQPIVSIQRFRKRMNNTYSSEQTTQVESKEKI
ncbi:Protein CBG12643 [Caenorhabditis briggsae]|uniref:Protein CBG12643 n=1 Tax=Caenorhabditis briggsae TaxID=6238 RepID=A8XG85_CAEBR|nr:Protein CBG12643 [Caenorhabditis briggsae]CAP31591.2 Protein CBG12643 [Caenorhabditis briggsae]